MNVIPYGSGFRIRFDNGQLSCLIFARRTDAQAALPETMHFEFDPADWVQGPTVRSGPQ